MRTPFLHKQTAFFILLFLTGSILSAQTRPAKQWDARFGGNNASNLFTVRQTTDSGYILGGLSSAGAGGEKTQPSQGLDDYWVVKTDVSGNKQWDARFGGNNFDEFAALQQTADGGYILGGTSASGISGDKSQASRGQDDYWIVKTDANGNKQWDARFGTVGADKLTVVQQTTDGGYILGGYAGSGISGDKTQAGPGGPADYWIIKTDANGNKQWDKVFGGTNEDDLQSIQQTNDGGYILGGSSLSNNNGDKTEATRGDWDYWIVKTDANGNKQWDRRFGGSGTDFFNSVQQTMDGGYILGGRSNSGISGDKTQGTQGSFDYWIVKINAAGVKQWDTRFGGSGDDQFTTLQQTIGGGYILGGYSASGISGDRTQDNWGNVDYWIVKTDANGNKLWDERFGTLAVDYLYSLQQTTDYGYILGGHTYGSDGDKSQASHGSYDYWIVKTAPDCIPQTFYADADHDGYGNPSVAVQNCVAPPGYVANNSDCDDTKLLYADADNDGYGAGSPIACGVANNTDCNDNDASVHAPAIYYRDYDGDGFGDANNAINACSLTPPQGYVVDSSDCDDTQLLYADADNDGYGAGSPVACGVANNTDCNDDDASVHAPAIYYKDYDGDGFGNPSNTTEACSSTPPQGYVANANDCNDNDTYVHTPITYYADSDGDSFGNPANTTEACSSTSPQGYVANANDCNDNDAYVHTPITYYADSDGDGFGNPSNTTEACSSTPPQGYVANANDCNDNDAAVHIPITYYADSDGDGFGNPANTTEACSSTPPQGYVANANDCNDNDAAVHIPITYYADSDGDGFGNPSNTTEACSSTPPQGYVANANDCSDNDAGVHTPITYYADTDGDGFGNPASTTEACSSTPPQGYVTNANDCNDNDAYVHTQVRYYADNDGDGFGNPSNTTEACSSTPPPNYVANANDCNDNDAAVHAPATYYKDNDGDGFGNANISKDTCSSTPPQGYVTNGNDCNDNNANIRGIVITSITKTSYKGADLSCANSMDGKITIAANGGSGTLQYSKDNGYTYQTNKVFNGLPAALYQVKVEDNQGCSSDVTNVTITAPSTVVITGIEKTDYNGSDVSCPTSKDGKITVTASGGTGGYKYSKNNGASYQASDVLSNLGAGTYQVVVKDTNNCTSSAVQVTITAPPVLSASVASTTNVNCKGGTDGSITVNADGGKPFYLYKLNTSNLYQNINVFNNLLARMYKVTVKDANECVASVDSIFITQPAAVSVTLVNKSDACKNGSNGFILVNATGGSGGYTYSLNNGPYTTNNTFTNLAPGIYKITAMDINGCLSIILSVTIKNGTAPCNSFSQQVPDGSAYPDSKLHNGTAWLKIQAIPDPFETDFNLIIQSNSKEDVDIVIMDMYGRKVYQAKGNINKQYKLGSSLASGVYIVQVIQGKKIQTLKVIKG